MQFECPSCKQVLEYADKRPSFCSHCGQALLDSNVHAAATLAYAPPGSTAGGDFVMGGARPQAVGPYRLVRELGQGGMGVVYEAEQEGTGRRVALKLLSAGSASSQESMERFLREGRLAAALSHPRSTFVYEAGEHAGQPFIVMELMPGRTLNDVCRNDGPLPVNRAVDYILDVIEGLEAAHAAGVIHRDVKPSNCFIDGDGRVKVGDFGLSKSLVTDSALTRTGAFMGTPLFAAPEQVRGDTVDERTDVYAVGATLFYLIANRGPFTGDAMAVSAQIVSDPAPSLGSLVPSVPKDLAATVARTLEKDPKGRYASLTELRRGLLPFASGGTSIADVGRRLGAYMIDAMLLGIVTRVPAALFGTLVGMQARQAGDLNALLAAGPYWAFVKQSITWILFYVYFTLTEGWWGRGLGKRVMGLRVVGAEGQPAGLARTALRSLFIPGGFGLSVAWEYYDFRAATTAELPVQWGFAQIVFGIVALWVGGYGPAVLCLLTMRARNGYRGVHELASGTRVVRLRTAKLAAGLSDVPVLAARALTDGARTFGPFRVIGSLKPDGPEPLLHARDDVLERSVWICVSPRDAARVADARIAVARSTRPRWLQGGLSGDLRWDAFEAVVGAPLRLVARAGGLPWSRARSVLLDLAEELSGAVADGTLPKQLSLDQIWIDRSGRTKLLDEPLASREPQSADARTDSDGDTDRALELFRAAADLCTRGQVLPGRVQEFYAALAARPADAETFVWVVRELHAFSEQSAVLGWDSRLGILGISTSFEMPLYGALVWLSAWGAWTIPGVPMALSVWLPSIVCMTVATAIGFWFRGGPVFRFMDIEVRRVDGRPASRLRCAWRNLVAWLPVIQTMNFGILMMAIGFNVIAAQGGNVPQFTAPITDVKDAPPVLLLSIMCSGCCLELFFLFGPFYSLARPQRGLQDLLAGTRLVPR